MLFGTSTNLYAALGAVSQTTFDDVWPYLVLVIGIPLAFFILEMLIGLIRGEPKTGYFQDGKRMKDQDLARHIYEVQEKGMTRFDE